jgi:dihydrofolate reductase
MTKIVADITVSLDGYVTGPDAGIENGLGTGGEQLHEWVFSGDPVDQAVLDSALAGTGVVVMGRRTYDIVDGPGGWSDEAGYGAGAGQGRQPQCLVLTHRAPDRTRLQNRFTFLDADLPVFVEQAKAMAPPPGDVVVMGGGDVVGQFLDAGLLDELRLHLAPIVLGSGSALFAGRPYARRRLRQVQVRVSPYATHLTYEVLPD